MTRPYHLLTLLAILSATFVLLLRAATTDSITYDEKLHLDSAQEWWSLGHSPSDPFNPPLSKLPAFLLVTSGVVTDNDPFLRLARLPTILFSLTLLGVLFKYSTSVFHSYPLSLLTILLLTLEPTFLAHGHLVTTDMLAALTYFLAVISWRTQWFPIALALLAATKLTLLPALFLYIVLEIAFSRKSLIINPKSLLLNSGIFLIILWALHGFWFRPVINLTPPLPLGEFINTNLHAVSYAINPKFEATRKLIYQEEVRGTGWYSYPAVAFFLKTSPTLLLLLLIGIWQLFINHKSYLLNHSLLSALPVFLVITLGRYSTGIRHLLPMYPFLALFAVQTIRHLPNRFISILLILLIPYHFSTALLTSDYIAYFNPAIGAKKGGQIISDSNLDWGQSLHRLAIERGAWSVPALSPAEGKREAFCSFMSPADPSLYGIHCQPLPPASKLNEEWIQNKTLLISRTTYYTQGYYLSLLQSHSPTMLANHTILSFTFP